MSRVIQPAHGFTALQVVRLNFGTGLWELAEPAARSVVRGPVTEVISAGAFVVTLLGPAKVQSHGLTTGTLYFIGAAGALASSPPATGQTNPLLYPVDADSVEVLPSQGGATAYRRSFTNADLSGDNLVVLHNMGRMTAQVSVYNSSNQLFAPAGVALDNANQLTVSFAGSTPLAGTWSLLALTL